MVGRVDDTTDTVSIKDIFNLGEDRAGHKSCRSGLGLRVLNHLAREPPRLPSGTCSPPPPRRPPPVESVLSRQRGDRGETICEIMGSSIDDIPMYF